MNENEDDFFLPDLCQAQSILLLVLVAELLVFVLVIANGSLLDFSWFRLGLTSLFVLWVVLLSAALLCNMRPWLKQFSTMGATAIAYGLIVTITVIFSVATEVYLIETAWAETTPPSWGLAQTANVARNLVVAAIMTGIAFRALFLQHQLRQQEKAELRSRVQALQSRIRPHFLFNSMNIIASLIQVDPDVAEEVVEDLSVLFRASLSDSSSQPVALREELALCEKYVHIESLRLDDRLTVEWDITADVDRIKIPMLTLQPLLENAIYHGIQPRPQGGTVVVAVSENDGLVTATVSNPIAEAGSSHDSGNRMALENIRRRLEANYGPGAEVHSGSEGETYLSQITYRPTPEA